jgi:hypothetical protein
MHRKVAATHGEAILGKGTEQHKALASDADIKAM